MRKELTIILLVLMAILVTAFGLAEESAADRTISFEENGYIIYVGRQQKLNVTVENLQETAPKQTQLVWTSSDQDVAAVNAGGMVNGKKAGKATITAAAKDNESISASVEVEVRVPVQSVQINEKNVSVVVGGKEEAAKAQLSVAIKPEDAFFQTGTWSSSNESVATVDSNGLVTGISAGNASITFTSDDPNGQKKAQTNIRVGQAVTGIQFAEAEINVPAGRNVLIKATVEPVSAANKKLVWTSSDEGVAKVGPNGQVQGIAPGLAVVTAVTCDGSDLSAKCNVTVVQPVKTISLGKQQTISIPVGYTKELKAVVEPENATIPQIAWTSSNENIATVDENGIVTGIAKGKAVITAAATDGSNVKRTISINVDEFDLVFTDKKAKHSSFKYGSGIYSVSVKYKSKCVKVSGFDGGGWMVLIGKDVRDQDITVTPVKSGTDVITIRAGKKKTTIKVYVADGIFDEDS